MRHGGLGFIFLFPIPDLPEKVNGAFYDPTEIHAGFDNAGNILIDSCLGALFHSEIYRNDNPYRYEFCPDPRHFF